MNRRELLRGAGATLFAAAARAGTDHLPSLPDNALFERSPEQYWARIRKDQLDGIVQDHPDGFGFGGQGVHRPLV